MAYSSKLSGSPWKLIKLLNAVFKFRSKWSHLWQACVQATNAKFRSPYVWNTSSSGLARTYAGEKGSTRFVSDDTWTQSSVLFAVPIQACSTHQTSPSPETSSKIATTRLSLCTGAYSMYSQQMYSFVCSHSSSSRYLWNTQALNLC